MPSPREGTDSPGEEYGQRLGERRAAGVQIDGQHRRLGYVRVLVVLAGAVVAAAALRGDSPPGWSLALPFVTLIALGFRMHRLEVETARLGRAAAFYERGLARLEGRWAGTGETGARFLDDKHLYAVDLDIFGRASLFELLSGARTRMGEETLAEWLLEPAPPDVVRARQEAVAELTTRLDLREGLAVIGEGARVGVHPEALAAWGEREPLLRSSGFRLVAWALSAIGAFAAAAVICATGACISTTPCALASSKRAMPSS